MSMKAENKLKVAIQIRVNADLYDALTRAAEQDNRSIPNTIINILDKALNNKTTTIVGAQAKPRGNNYVSVKETKAQVKQRVLEQKTAINAFFKTEVIIVQDSNGVYYMQDMFDQSAAVISTPEGAQAALDRRYFGVLDPRARDDEFVLDTMRSMLDYSREAYERITGEQIA